jgi:hypothetical protein
MRWFWIRCSLIVAWFVGLFVWNLPPGWTMTVDADKPRLLAAILGSIATPSTILLSIAVIFVILVKRVDAY